MLLTPIEVLKYENAQLTVMFEKSFFADILSNVGVILTQELLFGTESFLRCARNYFAENKFGLIFAFQ